MAISADDIRRLWDRLPLGTRMRLYGYDMYLNWKLGGDPTETVSSRAARARNLGIPSGEAVCRILERHDPGHCDRAIKAEHRDKPGGTPKTAATEG